MLPALNCYPTTTLTDMTLHPVIERARAKSSSSVVSFEPNWQWERYLDRLSDEGVGVNEAHVSAVRTFWHAVSGRLQRSLPLPVTLPTERGAVQLAWNRGNYVVEVDIFQDGRFDWFFRDRKRGTVDGNGDEPVQGLPKRFIERVRLLARG